MLSKLKLHVTGNEAPACYTYVYLSVIGLSVIGLSVVTDLGGGLLYSILSFTLYSRGIPGYVYTVYTLLAHSLARSLIRTN